MAGGWNWIDKTGMRFGKLIAKKYLGEGKWLCECDCGKETIVHSNELSMPNSKKRGTQSCGCAIGKLSKNNSFFSKIDTEAKAYILGFICTDGNVWCKNGSYFWKIRIQKQDEDVLKKIKEALQSKVEIKYQKDTVKLPNGNMCDSEMASLLICNKQNVLDLINYGIIPNKTHNLNFDFSCMEESLYRHFLRGVYDGDGTFGVYSSKTGGNFYETTLTGYIDFLKNIKEKINCRFKDMSINLHHAIGCSDDIFRMATGRKNDFFNLLDWLYQDNKICLQRKYKKYLDLKEKYIKNSND